MPVEKTWRAFARSRTCYHGCGGRQVGKVTHPAVVENSPCLHSILQPQDPGVRLLARWWGNPLRWGNLLVYISSWSSLRDRWGDLLRSRFPDPVFFFYPSTQSPSTQSPSTENGQIPSKFSQHSLLDDNGNVSLSQCDKRDYPNIDPNTFFPQSEAKESVNLSPRTKEASIRCGLRLAQVRWILNTYLLMYCIDMRRNANYLPWFSRSQQRSNSAQHSSRSFFCLGMCNFSSSTQAFRKHKTKNAKDFLIF